MIKRIAADIPVLLVEHDIDRVFALADRVTVMNEGRVLLDGTAEDARQSSKLREVYIGSGTAALAAQPRGHRERPAAELLQVERLNTFYGKSHVITDASLSVREGEIVALLGRNGAGKSTFLKSIIGIADARGELTLGSEALAGRSAAAIARLGVGYVPQGRALFAGMSVRHNLELGRLKRGRPGSGAWSDAKIVEFFPRLKSRLDTPRSSSPAASSNWWRSRALYRGMCACCSSTNRSRASRPRSSRSFSKHSTSCARRSRW